MKFTGKGRFIVALWLLPLFVVPGIEFIYSKFPVDTAFYWFDIFSFYYYYGLLALALYLCGYFYKVKWQGMFTKVELSDYYFAIGLTIFVFIFSLATAFLLFYPLSYIVPEFVEFWYLSGQPLIYLDITTFPFLANLLSFVAVVVFAPVVEEYVFRGYLLHRFSTKWNLRTGVILSSLVFGLTHADPIGAVAFGIAMCVIYLKTESLWVPIICHAFNNLLVWLWELYYVVNTSSMTQMPTVEDFRADWKLGSIAIIVTIVWIIFYLRKPASSNKLSLPDLNSIKA